MKKIITLLTIIFFNFSAFADDGPYIGAKVSKLKIDYGSVEGIDLADVYADEFTAKDIFVGYNLGNAFLEIGYIDGGKENKNLLSTTIAGITLSADTSLELEAWRLGGGYNYPVSDKFIIRPFANYYDVKFTETGSITVTAGSSTFTAAASADGSDSMIDAGLGLVYKFNDNSELSYNYSRTLDDVENVELAEFHSLSLKYNF